MDKEDFSWERICLNSAADRFFGSICQELYKDIIIVGISNDDETKSFIVSKEEKTISFAGLKNLSEELYKNSKEAKIWHEPGYHARFQNNAKKKYKAIAIHEFLKKSFDGIVIAGRCFRIIEDKENYYVVGVVLDKELYEKFPKFEFKTLIGDKNSKSFLDSAADVFLYNSALYLLIQDERFIGDTEYLERQTGERFFENTISEKCNIKGFHSLFSNINKISQLMYESSEVAGNILITNDDSNIEYEITFEEEFLLTQTRLIRKLLELTNDSLFLISDGAAVCGIGKINNNRKNLSKDYFIIKMKGNYSWSLLHKDKSILDYKFGIPIIPKASYDKKDFVTNIKKCFNLIDDKYIDCIYNCLKSLIEAKKGAILVISKEAKKEAKRLEKQGILVKPQKLNEGNIRNLSSIDGAILINEECMCYAIGVILDGDSLGNGSVDRGSRYNSSLRYCMYRRKTYREEVAAIVISEDGMVNFVPELRDKIKREKLINIFNQYLEIGKKTGEKEIHKISDEIFNRYRYYFTQEQCNRINDKKEEIESILKERNESYRYYEDIKQDEEFDESLIED